jgi:hypothetical protein
MAMPATSEIMAIVRAFFSTWSNINKFERQTEKAAHVWAAFQKLENTISFHLHREESTEGPLLDDGSADLSTFFGALSNYCLAGPRFPRAVLSHEPLRQGSS